MELEGIRTKLKELRRDLEDRKKECPKYVFHTSRGPHRGVHNAYVFWLDLLGAQNAMQLSIGRAARGIMKIHAAALAGMHDSNIGLFPVIDGVYGVTEDKAALETVLRRIFETLALSFTLSLHKIDGSGICGDLIEDVQQACFDPGVGAEREG